MNNNTVYLVARSSAGLGIETLSAPHDGTEDGIRRAARALQAQANREFPSFSNMSSTLYVTDANGKKALDLWPNLSNVKALKSEGMSRLGRLVEAAAPWFDLQGMSEVAYRITGEREILRWANHIEPGHDLETLGRAVRWFSHYMFPLEKAKFLKEIDGKFVRGVDLSSGAVTMPSWGRVGEAAGDITIRGVEITNAPQDDYDDDSAYDVLVKFSVRGETLARWLGVQNRVLQARLKELVGKKDRLIRLVDGNNLSEFMSYARGKVGVEIDADAKRRFGHGVTMENYSVSEGQALHSAVVEGDGVLFEIELDLLVRWKE